jgi:hypothetical protein
LKRPRTNAKRLVNLLSGHWQKNVDEVLAAALKINRDG